MTDLLNLSPGAGVLFVRQPFAGKAALEAFLNGVERGVPALCSCCRVSPFVSGSHGRNKMMGVIGHEVAQAMEGYNRHVDSKAKRPVVNRKYMTDFYTRMGVEEEQLMEGLGVADYYTRIAIGHTAKGGGVLFIYTKESRNRTRLFHAWYEAFEGHEGMPLHGADYARFVQDVAVLTALAKLNRMVMYYHICRSAGWPRKMSVKSYPTTIYSGLCPSCMKFHHDSVCVSDNSVFCVQELASTDILLMQAPQGKENRELPCWYTADYPSFVSNRVTLDCMAEVSSDNRWSFADTGMFIEESPDNL